jgi:hypothetical protein
MHSNVMFADRLLEERALTKIRRAFRRRLFSPLRSNAAKDGTIIGLTGREEKREEDEIER